MDPDPDPTHFFSDFTDAKKKFSSSFSYNTPTIILPSVLKLRKWKDPEPDPYILLMEAKKQADPDPQHWSEDHETDAVTDVVQEGSKSHLVVGRPCIARKIGFPELILPNDVRNDLYVNIFSAELSRLNKTADRNVEVC
jgi:hypothetical protein